MGRDDGVKAHGVVETCFNMAGAVGGGAVKVRNPNGEGLDATLKIRTDWSCKGTELILR